MIARLSLPSLTIPAAAQVHQLATSQVTQDKPCHALAIVSVVLVLPDDLLIIQAKILAHGQESYASLAVNKTTKFTSKFRLMACQITASTARLTTLILKKENGKSDGNLPSTIS